MFTIQFDELTLTVAGHRFTYAIEGEADILGFEDSSVPKVESISLLPDNSKIMRVLPESSPLWREMAAAIMQSCPNQISEGFEASRVKERQAYADEHRLRQYEVL